MLDGVCPICAGTALTGVLEQRDVPVHQNLVFDDQVDAVAIQRGDLDIRACQQCGFVFNLAFDPARLDYGPRYDNTQLASPVFQDYVSDLVSRLIDVHQVRNSRIVEVGCGNGAFLRALVADKRANNSGVGFDPSYLGPDSDFDGRLRFERRFYDESCTNEPVDVLVCRHVIEHVADPAALLTDFATALRDKPEARLFLETPCVEWVLRNKVVWDLFYEHCSLFTGDSLTTACAAAGFSVQSVTHTFGGQYLWLEATNAPASHIPYNPGEVSALARDYRDAFSVEMTGSRRALDALERKHTLALWGAGAKGSTFANLLDPQRQRFACLVDINPAKQGAFLGGTGHPIVGPHELIQRGITGVVVLNPNYVDEIRADLRRLAVAVEVIDLGAT